QESFWMSWRERLTALRNLPPVLKIVWESGRLVVTLGILFRVFVALLPLALAWVTKLIVDGIVNVVKYHHPVPNSFWWLLVAEFSIALIMSLTTRVIDYLDQLLADKYTRFVSIEVMRHAAELDLIAYEDPVFYDRLERARVQATDRLAMIQALGRLIL